MKKTVWETNNTTVFDGKDDLASLILKSRGFKTSEIDKFLQPDYSTLSNPSDIPDMEKAVRRILKAKKNNEKIVIYGDYDIDGLTASALLYDFFKSTGFDVSIYIPDRFEEGYGLNIKAIELLAKKHDLIITVDCGTSSNDELKYAKKIGVDIIVTDHHELSKKLSKDALAIVNPQRINCDHPAKILAGVGVAFYLVRALQAHFTTDSEFSGFMMGREKWLLDLVALGTVCDVAPLISDNRILVYYGLKVLRKSKRQGLRALAEVAASYLEEVNENTLGFRFGPRLNAAGRLEHANKSLNLLIADNLTSARKLAHELDTLNTNRRNQTEVVFKAADLAAKRYSKDPILVLADPDWSHGIVGIVASKLSEKWQKPVILMQQLSNYAKGSARSFNNFNIIEAIEACRKVLVKYGGHAFAAGITIENERIEEFRYRINQFAIQNMDLNNNFKRIKIDVDIGTISLARSHFESVKLLQPYGCENPEAIFYSHYKVAEVRAVGVNNSHLKLRLIDKNDQAYSAIGFGKTRNWSWLDRGDEIEAVYKLKENFWQGYSNLELELVDIRKRTKK